MISPATENAVAGHMRPAGLQLDHTGIADENTIFGIAWKMTTSKRHK